jgi:hypothetical protein
LKYNFRIEFRDDRTSIFLKFFNFLTEHFYGFCKIPKINCHYYLKKHKYLLIMDVLYSSPNIVRVIKTGRLRWEEDATRTEKNRSALVGKHDGKRAFGTSRHK